MSSNARSFVPQRRKLILYWRGNIFAKYFYNSMRTAVTYPHIALYLARSKCHNILRYRGMRDRQRKGEHNFFNNSNKFYANI